MNHNESHSASAVESQHNDPVPDEVGSAPLARQVRDNQDGDGRKRIRNVVIDLPLNSSAHKGSTCFFDAYFGPLDIHSLQRAECRSYGMEEKLGGKPPSFWTICKAHRPTVPRAAGATLPMLCSTYSKHSQECREPRKETRSRQPYVLHHSIKPSNCE